MDTRKHHPPETFRTVPLAALRNSRDLYAAASIAARFMEEDGKRFRHELHHDAGALRAEIESLREELQHPIAKQ